MESRDRHWRALLIAPLAAVPVAFLAIWVSMALDIGGEAPESSDSIVMISLVLAVVYGLPASYIVTAAFGSPVARVLWRSGRRSLAQTALAGAAVGLVVSLVALAAGAIFQGPWVDMTETFVWWAVVAGVAGFVVAAAYWKVGSARAPVGTPG